MDDSLAGCVDLLAELISYPSQNPGGDEHRLCAHLGELLERRGADRVTIAAVPREGQDHGAYVYACFGEPRLLINAHVDTVPPNTGWQQDPFSATVTDERVVGLGAADTKGAIAAILAALDRVTPEDVGILFSGDEERGTQIVRAFAATDHCRGLERAIVCEPTARQAGIRHRGICCYRALLRGEGGHSSRADFMPKPIVTLARLAVELDELGIRERDQGPPDMKGLCMNVAALDGGVAFNVVPDAAELTFSIRPPPAFDEAAFELEVEGRARQIDPDIRLETSLSHPPFECRAPDVFRALLGSRVRALAPLQFWTEAAVLSAAGIDSVVLGPGDIAQAHAAGEFVSVDDLAWAVDLFTHVFEETRGDHEAKGARE